MNNMKKQAVHRMHNFPDADLYQQCIDRIRFALRDIKHFEQYSYGKDRLKSLQNQCEKFRSLPDDDELVGGKSDAAPVEDRLVDECRIELRIRTEYELSTELEEERDANRGDE